MGRRSRVKKYRFEITRYSLKKRNGVGNYIRSPTFAAAGCDWTIRFYPSGDISAFRSCVSFQLELLSTNAVVQASYDLRLVNQVTGDAKSINLEVTPVEFKSRDPRSSAAPKNKHVEYFRRDRLETQGYIHQDCLTVECVLTVFETQMSNTTTSVSGIKVPPSNLSEHFGRLLLEEVGKDVTFSVGGEAIAAHRIVLAARSPVFKAELYGPMKEGTAQCVTIEEMQPDVFRALLHFIYTDSLPDLDHLGDDDHIEMIRCLFVAADIYALDRLKLLCESTLADYLDIQSVAATLDLADQHNCASLKDVCIEFMVSSNEMEAVVATQGYESLKRTRPSVLVDVLERMSKIGKRHKS